MPDVFLDFQLPNATTWFYFSLLLAIALFFKFRRFLSIRNWDLVSLFALFPGLLLLPHDSTAATQSNGGVWAGYLWLICGSAYLFVRCVLDLAIVRRPALAPNLDPGGLTWLGCALFVCLISVALRSPDAEPNQTVGRKSVTQAEVERRVETAAGYVAGPDAQYWTYRALAIVCHFAVVAGLVMVGWRHFQDVHLGMAAATLYLLLPYTGLYVGQLHHVWPTALLVWALVFYRRPALTGWLLGLATGGGAYFPIVLFPVWWSFYRNRGAARFAASFGLATVLSLAAIGLYLWFRDDLRSSLSSVWEVTDWQAWKEPVTQSFWRGIHWAYRLPVFVLYLTFVILTTFWPMPKNLGHVIALSAANFIGIQFWYADQGGVYVLWYLPILVLLVFRPNLSDRLPPLVVADPGRLTTASRVALNTAVQMLRGPDQTVRVG